MSPFMCVGSAPTFPVEELVPLLWCGPALRQGLEERRVCISTLVDQRGSPRHGEWEDGLCVGRL